MAPGRRLFLHGPSGSGKTTLLSVISGILLAQEGEVRVLGHDLKRLSLSARDILRGSEIGYIFQNFKRRSRMGALSLSEEVHRIASRLDIHANLDAAVTRLSTGQQQRVAIARAIIGSPPLVIADEPTSSLDADRRDAFLALLTEMIVETQSTLLFVSHDLSLAPHFDESLSLASLNRGRTIVQGAA